MKKRLLIIVLIIGVLAVLCSCAKEPTDITALFSENTMESMQTESIAEDISEEITSDNTTSETGYSMEFTDWIKEFRNNYKELCEGDTVTITGCAVYPTAEIVPDTGSHYIINFSESSKAVPGTTFTERFVFSDSVLFDGLAQKLKESYKEYGDKLYLLNNAYDVTWDSGYHHTDYAYIAFDYVLPEDYSDNYEYLNGAKVTFIIGSIGVNDYAIDDEFVKSYSEDYTGHQFDSVDELYEWWKNRKEESIFK